MSQSILNVAKQHQIASIVAKASVLQTLTAANHYSKVGVCDLSIKSVRRLSCVSQMIVTFFFIWEG